MPAAPGHRAAFSAETTSAHWIAVPGTRPIVKVPLNLKVYYALPHTWLKLVWGIGVGAAIYLVLVALQRALVPQPARDAPPLAG